MLASITEFYRISLNDTLCLLSIKKDAIFGRHLGFAEPNDTPLHTLVYRCILNTCVKDGIVCTLWARVILKKQSFLGQSCPESVFHAIRATPGSKLLQICQISWHWNTAETWDHLHWIPGPISHMNKCLTQLFSNLHKPMGILSDYTTLRPSISLKPSLPINPPCGRGAPIFLYVVHTP